MQEIPYGRTKRRVLRHEEELEFAMEVIRLAKKTAKENWILLRPEVFELAYIVTRDPQSHNMDLIYRSISDIKKIDTNESAESDKTN